MKSYLRRTGAFLSICTILGWSVACGEAIVEKPAGLPGWRLAYSHDEDGVARSGSKEELLAAVRGGKPVRIYLRGRRVEHVADAGHSVQGDTPVELAVLIGDFVFGDG